MARTHLDRALPHLAGPIRRRRVGSTLHLLAEVRGPMKGAWLTVRQLTAAGDFKVVGSTTAKAVSGPPGTTLAALALDLGAAASVPDSELQLELDLDLPSGPQPLAARWLGDLAMATSVCPIVDLPEPLGRPRSGQLRLLLGPLDLGRLELQADTGSAPAVVEQATRAGLAAALATPGGPAAVGASLDAIGAPSGPTPQTRVFQLDRAGLGRLAQHLSTQPVFGPPDPKRAAAWQQVHAAVWAAYDPGLELSGYVAPRLLGLRLSPAPVPVAGRLGLRTLSARALLPLPSLLAALWPAPLSRGHGLLTLQAPLPVPPGLSPPPGVGADLPPAERLRRWMTLVEGAGSVVGLDLRLAGLRLGAAGARVILPGRAPHPAPGWTPPEQRRRPGPPAPSRAQLIAAALAGSAPLLDPTWDEHLEPLQGFVPGTVAPVVGRRLAEWFPHGGIIGGGTLQVPALLAEAPLSTLAGLPAGAWASADALRSAIDRLLEPRPLAQLALYLPAPAPAATDTLQHVDALADLDIAPETLPGRTDFPAALALFEAAIFPPPGATRRPTLLGIELGGGALSSVSTPAGPQARLRVRPVGGDWLQGLLGPLLPQELDLTLLPASGAPLEAAAALLPTVLRAVKAGRTGGELDELAAWLSARTASGLQAATGQALREPQRAWLRRAHRDEAAPLGVLLPGARQLLTRLSAAPTDRDTLARAATLFDGLLRASLPRVGFELPVALPSLPGLSGLLQPVGAMALMAWSPGESTPGVRGAERVAAEGGIGLRISRLESRFAGLKLSVADAFIAVVPTDSGHPPILRARLRASSVGAVGLTLHHADLEIDTSTAWKARVKLAVAPLHWRVGAGPNAGGVYLEPDGGPHLSLTVELGTGRAWLEPARLRVELGLLKFNATLRGKAAGKPVALSLDGPWKGGRAELSQITLHNPLAPASILASWPAGRVASVEGKGLGGLSLDIAKLGAKVLALAGSALPLTMDDVGRLQLDTLGAMALRAPARAAIPGVVELAGALSLGVDGAGPTARLDSGLLTFPGLGSAQLSAPVVLGSSGHTASGPLSGGRLGIAGLAEVDAGRWAVTIAADGAQVALQATQTPQAWFLGEALPSLSNGMLPRVVLPATGARVIEAAAGADWSPPGLSNLLRARPHLTLTGSSLALGGAFSALKQTSGGGWKLSGTLNATVDAAAPEFGLPVSASALTGLLGSSGVLRKGASTALRAGRDSSGWWLKLLEPEVHILWLSWSDLSATVASSGQVEFSVNGATFSSSGLTLTPGSALLARANLRAPSLGAGYVVPAGLISSTIPGWPAGTLSFPRIPASGWESTLDPTTSADESVSRTWRDVPLIGGATGTQYRVRGPEIRVRLRASDPRLRAYLRTGGLQVRQWNPVAGKWAPSFNIGSDASYTISSGGGLSGTISFPGVSGAGSDNPKLGDLTT